MFAEKKIVVIMPAYNAEKTLEKTYRELPTNIIDEVIVVDDCSDDETVKIAKGLNLETFVHEKNMGYGANQKTCYREALKKGADIIVMLHPDHQYSPGPIGPMVELLANNVFDIVLGSRILEGMALKGGMPLYKFIANRFLTFVENPILGTKLSEYHTGFRAFTREVLATLPLLENSDDFLFDNEILVQAVYSNFRIGEISAPARYHKDASSVNFIKSLGYGFGVLKTALKFILQKNGLAKFSIFDANGKKVWS